LALATPTDTYAHGPVARLRQWMTTPGGVDAGTTADLAKVADTILDSAETTPAPRRLVLGSDAYQGIHQTLSERLAALADQRELARSTDAG
jgi:hypothetical protein